jgi:glycosyl transferase family 2
MLTFSIVTPTVMRQTLVRTCRSVDAQRDAAWQHLVMVDKPESALTAAEQDMLRALAHPQREITFCSTAHADCGNSCRSDAWARARGDYLLYVDDDDYLLPDAIEVLHAGIRDQVTRPVWGVFPIERFGERFLHLPPARGRTCSTQFFHQPLAGGSELRFPLGGYDADGMFVDSLAARFPYVCIDPGRPLAVVDQSHGGSRVTIDRESFEAAFHHYVTHCSIETEAISLEASYYLLDLLMAARVDRILDLGSGWSSFVFRFFKRLSGRDVHVCSVDTSEHWRTVTAGFLADQGLDSDHLRLWPDLGEGTYDLVFFDIGRPWERPPHLETAFDRTSRTLICDDMHYPEYRQACEALAAARGLQLQLLAARTTDRFGRFLGRIDKR